MITFCPTCGTLLMVEYCELTRLRYACQTCPYVYMIDRKVSTTMERRESGICGRMCSRRINNILNSRIGITSSKT
eukprot:1192762-Prorocentrum_minimum.AAC.2